MQQFTDQLGNIIELSSPPKRIVSLVPSQTEFLFDLGLDAEIVGITRFCIHPSGKFSMKEKIGGTKSFNFEKIKMLQPDLIIGNKEENYQEGIEELQKYYPVWMSDITTLEDAYNMMLKLGEVVNKEIESKRIVSEIKFEFEEFGIQNFKISNPTCAYFIWRKPYMVAASETFINEMLEVIGFKNVFENHSRYPEIDTQLLAEAKPDFIFLSSEPYSFSEKHLEEFKELCLNSKVILVDGELFSWYGSRLKFSPRYFKSLVECLGM